jgi:LacI family transcriptional regulator
VSRIRIHDVAERAGVSIKTVSRVINREPNVRGDTRERVETAIAELRYTPNPFARSLAGNRGFVLGLLYDNPSSSYVIDIQRGTLSVCQREHYDLLIHPCDYRSSGLPAEVEGLLRQSRVDGFLLTPPLSDHAPLLARLRACGAHYVRVAPGDHEELARSVYTNDRESCAAMTEYLASLGHESIAFVVGDPAHKAVADRYRGYRDGLRAAGLPLDRSLVKQGFNTFQSGIDCGLELLRQNIRPTAVFASNDEMAIGVMRVAHQAGLRIPGDLSVVGFDDIPIARQMFPALTTIRQPVEAMAMTATDMLLGQLRGMAQASEPVVLESVVQLRESTGPGPQAGHALQPREPVSA